MPKPPRQKKKPLGHSIDDGIFLRIRGVRQGVRLSPETHIHSHLHYNQQKKHGYISSIHLIL